MSVKFDVNACLEAAMRANPNASREFLTRALSQTLTNVGQATGREYVEAQFDIVRARVGAEYKGAPLHSNPGVKLQGAIPRVYACDYVKNVNPDDSVEESLADSDLRQALKDRGGLDVDYVFFVGKGPGQSYQEESGSLIVRVKVDEEGDVSVVDVPETEDGKEKKVRNAFSGLSIPANSIPPGVYDLQIGFTDPVESEGES